MLRTSSLGLGLALLSLGAVPACMSDDGGDGDDLVKLPGDIDDNPGHGGKGDVWNADNDPTNLANNLTYVLASLPKDGKLDQPVWKDRFAVQAGDEPIWADTYWPTTDGSTNTRWVSASTRSPLEKYDAAFNSAPGCATQPASRCGAGAKAAWDKYLACAGPAAKWQAVSFQSALDMYDGLDSDGDGKVDECDDNDGIGGWWGLCHAWTPASLLEPEPRHAVDYAGQHFEVSDIKGLMLTLYDSTDAVMLGGRCNAETIAHDGTGNVSDPYCKDVNAGALHVILTNFLGLHDQALIEDRTANTEVWNQPVYGYHVSMQKKVTATRANTCIGASGSTYKPNPIAKSLYEVKTTVQYVHEGSQSTSPLGMSGYLSTDTYHYILEINSVGKIVGGEYCTESKDAHPDFLWSPTAVRTSSYGRNPGVDLAKVRTLLAMSRDAAPPTGPGTSFSNTTPTAIPDNDATGASVAVPVGSSVTFTSLTVAVDIAHTYRGDLRLELLHDGVKVKTLLDQQGGATDDVKDTYTLSTTEAGTKSTGTWTLHVVDAAAEDVGTVKSVTLTFVK